MEIKDYNRYGTLGWNGSYVLCEDWNTDNSPQLNKAGFAYAVSRYSTCDKNGFYQCCCLYVYEDEKGLDFLSSGCFGKSVSFNPETEEFKYFEPKCKQDNVRLIDYEFYIAVATVSLKELKNLVQQGANPLATIYDIAGNEYYSIHRAALNNDINVLKYMISLGENSCRINSWWAQPLSYAVRENSLEIVKFLVEEGNNPCNEDLDGVTVLAESALNPDIRVVEYLMSCGAELDAGALDCTELAYALRCGTVERMKFFIDHGSDLNLAMESSCFYAPLENLQYALECGYDPNSWTERYENCAVKIIDKLTPKRKTLFAKFGGVEHCKYAEIKGDELPD